jgi:DNA-binding NarL/FixJ family response regulator
MRDSGKYNILLVDDYPPVRRAIRRIIEANPEFQVVGELNDGLELLKFMKKSPAHLVVLDISMPHLGGFEAALRLKRVHPEVKVLILTIHNYKEYLDRALFVGAEGYLLKEEVDEELLPAITSLRQGEKYISSRISI